MFVYAALVSALFFVSGAMGSSSCSRSYTVVEGDTCDSISAAQHASTYQLATLNVGVINSGCTNLQPGQTLCLGSAGEDCTTTAVVQENDTCDTIMNAAGVNATLLWLNNPQIDSGCTNIYIGEVLCVSPTGQAPPSVGNVVAVAPAPSTPTTTPSPSPSTSTSTSSSTPTTTTSTTSTTTSTGGASPTPAASGGGDDDGGECTSDADCAADEYCDWS